MLDFLGIERRECGVVSRFLDFLAGELGPTGL